MVYDLSGMAGAVAGSWLAGAGRGEPPLAMANPPVGPPYVDSGFGYAGGAGRDLIMVPPHLLRAWVMKEVRRPRGVPTQLVPEIGTFALDQGRITGTFAPPDLGLLQHLGAEISVPQGSSSGGLIFRAGLRSRRFMEPTTETVLFEHTLHHGDPAFPVRVAVGSIAPLNVRLFIEVEAVGDGRGEVGVWEGLRIGTLEELDRHVGTVTSSLQVMRTEAGTPTQQVYPPVQGATFFGPVYSTVPDDPYVITMVYSVDRRGVTANLAASPRRPASVSTISAAGGEGSLGLSAGAPGPYSYFVNILGTWKQWGKEPGWRGGLQAGQAVSEGNLVFDLDPMGGDGDSGASWFGVVKIAMEDDEDKLPPQALLQVRDAFVQAVMAQLESALPLNGTRTGLTLAEAHAVIAKIDAAAPAAVSSVLLPLLGAQPGADDLVGVVHEAFLLDDLRAGPVTRKPDVTGGEGSRYRVTITAS